MMTNNRNDHNKEAAPVKLSFVPEFFRQLPEDSDYPGAWIDISRPDRTEDISRLVSAEMDRIMEEGGNITFFDNAEQAGQSNGAHDDGSIIDMDAEFPPVLSEQEYLIKNKASITKAFSSGISLQELSARYNIKRSIIKRVFPWIR